MDKNEIRTILKIDLQISASAYDTYLLNLIDLAIAAIKREGINLSYDDTANASRGDASDRIQDTGDGQALNSEDSMLIEMYAAFLFRKRREAEVSMPRALRWQLNNRLLSQKAGE